jgi:protease-4
MKIGMPFKGKIGVIELFGAIMGGKRTATHVELINSLKDNGKIKSVILNIDSPGGVVSASDSLYMAISRLSSEKPVVAYISGVGASGAYMISCAATKTVALPSAIIGSIGVISAHPILEELLHKIGIHFSVTKKGHLKDMGAFYRRTTEEEEKKEQELIDSFYSYFVELVAKKRKLDEKTVRGLATGEIFMAEKARELGLVDEIGDFETALDLASELGNVPKRIMVAKPPQTLTQKLLSRSISTAADEVLVKVESLLYGRHYYI